MFYTKPNAIREMNKLGRGKVPFLFITDFELEKTVLLPRGSWLEEGIHFSMWEDRHPEKTGINVQNAIQWVRPISLEHYQLGFDHVMKHILHGNSYLLNLTYPSEIGTGFSLETIFRESRAPYKLLWKDRFTVFSPETFIRISQNRIFSNPMKGTIDAGLPGALEKLLQDKKEIAEHYTIVDLIRNDLNQVAKGVRVDRFRYVDTIESRNRILLQTSSEISGTLDAGWEANIGSILFAMLPAGSVSGAPKQRTLEIIREAERGPRGYYTGVFGHFDGKSLDSAVMIRFIEKSGDRMYFRSGGGITASSDCGQEYEELKNKIYVPII
jgi:para-aminobenzoate synthetase component 1